MKAEQTQRRDGACPGAAESAWNIEKEAFADKWKLTIMKKGTGDAWSES